MLRRPVFLGALATTILVGCANSPGSDQRVPTLDDVKAYMAIAAQQLPIFVQEVIVTGVVPAPAAATLTDLMGKFVTANAALQVLPDGANAMAIINDIGIMTATIMSLIPQAAPFAPLVIALQALVVAFVARQPVAVGGTTIPVPTPPAPILTARWHARTQAKAF